MATLSGKHVKGDGTPLLGDIIFTPIAAPTAVNSDVVGGPSWFVTTGPDGSWSTQIRAGEFRVEPPQTRPYVVVLPDDLADYAVPDVVATGLTQPPPPFVGNGGGGGGSTPIATTTIAGKVRVHANPETGEPTVYLFTETDTLLTNEATTRASADNYLNSTLTSQGSRITAVETEVDTHESELTVLDAQVDTQGANITANTTAINANTAAITTTTGTANAANATAQAAQQTANAANATAQAAKTSADAATAAAAGFPVSAFLGNLTTLASDPGVASANSGKWWQCSVAGTLSNANAGGLTVAIGDRLLSNGTAWVRYIQPPTYIPDGTIVRAKLEPVLRDALTIADGFPQHLWGVEDNQGRLGLWLDPAGILRGHSALTVGTANGLSVTWNPTTGSTAISLGTINGSLPVGPTVLQSAPEYQGWFFAILDVVGRMGLGIDTAGIVTANIAEIVQARDGWPTLAAKLGQSLTPYGIPKNEITGQWFLRNWRLKNRFKADGIATELSLAYVGDSWTTYGYTLQTTRRLIAQLGDAGAGWVGLASATIFGQPATAALGSVDPAVVTVTRSGTWVDTLYSGQGPDTCAATSSTVGSRITLNLKTGATGWMLHYQIKPGYGNLRIRFDGGAWNIIGSDTGGAAQYATRDLTPFTTNTGPSILDIEIESGTNSVFGVHIRRGTNGLRVSQVAVGGNRSDFILNSTASQGWAEIKPDLFSVLLATNDMFNYVGTGYPQEPPALTPLQFRDNLIALGTKLRAAVPLVDLLFICAAETVRRGPNGETIDDYADSMAEAASKSKAAFINLRRLFGNYADYAPPGTGLDLYKDTLHPSDNRGMRLISDAIYKLLMPS